VANLLDAKRAVERLDHIGADADLRRYLLSRTTEAREAARTRLTSLASGLPRNVELWDDGGSRVLEVSTPGPASAGATALVLPPAGRPTRPGISELQTFDGIVFSDLVVEIRDERLPAAASARSGRLGYLLVRSTFSVSPPGIISRLVGQDTVVAIGNRTGGTWTDFSKVVPAPVVDLTRAGVIEYRTADGERRVGATANIPETSWVALVDFPRAGLVAPAQRFLEGMIPVALFFVASGTILAGMLAARITIPLAELSRATASIAGGDYSRRVATRRRDEIGRLDRAFNAMTGQIQEAQQRLEARVAERTAELAGARHEADRANRAKSEFLSLMSHDLRTPLNAILGFAQLLKEDHLDAEQHEHVCQILSGGQHLLDLISDVLDITRIETGQLSLSLEPMSVRDVVHRAVELVKPLAAQRDITLEIDAIAPHQGVRADRQRLHQILLNLLSNAVKYNRHGGRVTLAIVPTLPGRCRISVTDTGAGIPDSKVALLFQPFERLGAEQTSIEGTGLGLALSRALAEAMGGSLGVTSVVDSGSTFWVELAEAEHQDEMVSATPSTQPAVHTRAAQGGVVLYIEDNLSNVRLIERILGKRPAIELLHAPHGAAGLAMVRERHPDLVLLDMHLPGMSGEEVLRDLWSDPATRSLPVVVMTADATPGLARRLKAAGATAYLTKPLDVAEVLQIVDSLLNARPGVRDG
jgi:signal transduction histidine kinase/CheY-like chemotaxis protein